MCGFQWHLVVSGGYRASNFELLGRETNTGTISPHSKREYTRSKNRKGTEQAYPSDGARSIPTFPAPLRAPGHIAGRFHPSPLTQDGNRQRGLACAGRAWVRATAQKNHTYHKFRPPRSGITGEVERVAPVMVDRGKRGHASPESGRTCAPGEKGG